VIDLYVCRLYFKKRDWAGIGRAHRMIDWNDRGGMPQSIVT